MATIQFEEPEFLHRTRSTDSPHGTASGVFSTRTHSIDGRSSRSRGRRISVDRRTLSFGNIEQGEDQDAGLRQDGDFKHRQVSHDQALSLQKL